LVLRKKLDILFVTLMKSVCGMAKFPVTLEPAETSRTTTEPRVTADLLSIFTCEDIVELGPIQTSSPMVTLPAIMAQAGIKQRSPMLTQCAMCTKQSVFV
jgi:hypothetical protein